MSADLPDDTQELIPLSERLRYLWLFRLSAVVVVALFAPLERHSLGTGLPILGAVTVAYLGFVALIEFTWRHLRGRHLRLFGAVLIVDAAYLAWVAFLSTPSSPLYYVRVVQLVVVALLASYRTGLRLALWHSALAFLGYYVLTNTSLGAHQQQVETYGQLAGFVSLFWLVTLATTTYSALNERELRRRRYDLEALAKFSDDVEAAELAEDIGALYVDAVADAFGFERMLLVGGPNHDMSLIATVGCTVPASERSFTGGSGSVITQTLAKRRTALVHGLVVSDDSWLARVMPNAGNLIIVPLSSDQRVLGAAIIEHSLPHGSRVEQRVVEAVERFTAHLSLALENAWLLAQVRRSAATDGLTGIANRAHFDVSLEQQIGRAVRSQEPTGLLLVDIDFFKRLNDQHGHQAGDEVLRRVAAIISETTGLGDLPARYGGEEFAVILASTGLEDALVTAERLRLAVRDGDVGYPVTVSIGVATFPEHGATGFDVIRAADEALYDAKSRGRNRVMGAPRRLAAVS